MKPNKRKLKLLNFFNKRNNKNKNRKKRSGKKRRIFGSAILAGKLLFGNLETNDLKTQKYSNATPLTHQKVISDQEFNSLNGSRNSGKLIWTGNGIILEFQQKVSNESSNKILNNLNEPNDIILVKSEGILPGAEAFPLPLPQRPGGRTTTGMNGQNPGQGGGGGNSNPGSGSKSGSCSSNTTPRFPHRLSSNHQNQNNKTNKKKKNSQQVSKQKVIEAYQNFISEMNDKGYEVNIDEDRFIELSKNPQTGKFDNKSIFEAEGGLQGEVEGLYSNLRRTRNPKVDLDFEATTVKTGKTIFVDHKGMIDFGSLSDIGIDTSGFPSHESVAFNMGKDSVDQKGRFVGLDKGPKSRSDVLHLYNFQNIQM